VPTVLTDLGITDGTAGQILSTDGAGNFSFVADAGGIALTDLSITTAAAGTAALAYDNTTGVFTYTPPDLSTKADLAGNATQAFSASQISLGADWSMQISGTALRFFYQGTPVSEISATGQITAASDVIVNGTL
jgi:hypothetical protein